MMHSSQVFTGLGAFSVISFFMYLVVLRHADPEVSSANIPRRKALSSKDQEFSEVADKTQTLPSYCQSFLKKDLPTIYMVTPTYRRAEQIAELTRTSQTLLHVPNLVWIVAEDAPSPSPEVLECLKNSRLRHVYLRAEMPKKFLNAKNKPRGVANRNAGIEWIRKNAVEGVVYFGDDDNTYDLRVFQEIRSTKKVSMFPVGLIGELGVSTPVVRDGRVVGFYDGWIAKRIFPVDMAGFAINVKLFQENPTVLMPYIVGYEEDHLLRDLKLKMEDIEPKADNCSKILVWHTQTKKNKPVKNVEMKKEHRNTNLEEMRKKVWKGI